MRLTWMTVPIAGAVLGFGASPWGFGQSSTAGSSGQTTKKSTSAQSAALTPQEKEAQKHYRIALEAIKNNDFSTASDELKAASELAPKNALIWYNLAVVESKKGDSASALMHLQQAENLGLPKTLTNEADQLDAKLSYEVEKANKEKADELKRKQLSDQIHSLLDGLSARFSCRLNERGDQSGYATIMNNGSCQLKVDTNTKVVSNLMDSGDGQIWTRDFTDDARVNLADVLPEVSVVEKHPIYASCNADDYWVVISAKSGKNFPATKVYRQIHQYWFQGAQQQTKTEGDDPYNDVDTAVLVYFRGSAAAIDAARRLSKAIRLCSASTDISGDTHPPVPNSQKAVPVYTPPRIPVYTPRVPPPTSNPN